MAIDIKTIKKTLKKQLIEKSMRKGLQLFALLKTLNGTQRLLALIGGLIILSGLLFLIAPVSMASLFGLTNLLPAGITDVRAFYGGMTIALGLLISQYAFQGNSVIPGLRIIIAFAGGSAIGRLIGMALDSSIGPLHLSLLIGEVACVYFAVKSIAKENNFKEKNKPVLNPTRVEDFQPLSFDNLENPYPFYKALRDQSPVYKVPGADYYAVTRYDDIREVAMNTEDFSSKLVAILLGNTGALHDAASFNNVTTFEKPELDYGPVDVLAISDPPDHTNQRRISLNALSLRLVRGLEDNVSHMANSIMDRFIDRGECDWVQEFAKEIPMVISLQLTGCPTEDWKKVKRWGDQAIGLLSGVNTPEQFADNSQAGTNFHGYVIKHYMRQKANPEPNFTGALIEAANDPDNPLTEEEAISMVFQVLIAGADSSANTIGNAVKLLAENPHIQLTLRKDPTRIPNFIEEVLRLESPFQGHFRQTKKAVTVAGTLIPQGARVMLVWASGNRDERHFDNPEQIDLDRKNLKSHLAFGRGIHQCLGAQLARLEIKIALQELLKRTELIVLGEQKKIHHVPSIFIRELHSLPIRFEARKNIGAFNAKTD